MLNRGAGEQPEAPRRAHGDRVDLVEVVVCGAGGKAEPASDGGVGAADYVVLRVRLEGAVVVIVVQRYVPLAWLQTLGEDDYQRSFRGKLEEEHGPVNSRAVYRLKVGLAEGCALRMDRR